MKRVLHQLAQRLPLVGLLHLRMRARLHALRAPSARMRLESLRRDLGTLLRIAPLFVARNRQGFFEASERASLPDLSVHLDTLRTQRSGTLRLQRFCLCCNETTPMLVDNQFSHLEQDGSRTPNWRERLVCSGCAMNNRQRLVAKLVQQRAARIAYPAIYLMEQVTPIFEWVRKIPGMHVEGSEYLGYKYEGGQRVNGIRHEDVMNLSYADESFDLIVSNDVLEHIPDPAKALRECFRVLKPGGAVLATFPFHVDKDTTVTRARLVGNAIEHLLPPHYHGNPVSSEGSLVFHDFGWELLDLMRGIGFAGVDCESYGSDEFGHFGPGLLVFRLRKASRVRLSSSVP